MASRNEISKVMYLLDILSSSTKGYEQKLDQLYSKVLNENNEYRELKKYAEQYTYFGTQGKDLLKQINEQLNRSAINADTDLISRAELLAEQIKKEITVSRSILESPFITGGEISVVRTAEITGYLDAYRAVANAAVYMCALYDGIDRLKGMIWNEQAGIREMIGQINQIILPLAENTSCPEYGWMIVKKPGGKGLLFSGDSYYLETLKRSEMTIRFKGVRAERLSGHAYFNREVLKNDLHLTPYCWGIGNLLSVYPKNAMDLLKADGCVTALRTPSKQETAQNMPVPSVMLRTLTDGKHYCISPAELVHAMNVWTHAKMLTDAQNRHICMFCGRSVPGGSLVCSNHFTGGF